MIHTPASEGARLLELALSGKTDRQAEGELGFAGGQISRFRSGRRTPEYTSRVVLLDAYRIPMDAWDRAPDAIKNAG